MHLVEGRGRVFSIRFLLLDMGYDSVLVCVRDILNVLESSSGCLLSVFPFADSERGPAVAVFVHRVFCTVSAYPTARIRFQIDFLESDDLRDSV